MKKIQPYNKAIVAFITAFIIALLTSNGFEVPDDSVKLINDLVSALIASGVLSFAVYQVPNRAIKKEEATEREQTDVGSNTK